MNNTDNNHPGEEIEDIVEGDGAVPEDVIEVVETILGNEEDNADLPIPEEDSSAENEAKEETPEEQVEKWKEIAARSQADLENYRKRMAREKTEAIQYANRNLLTTLLPVIDNFEMGLQAAKQENPDSMIYQGMAMVQKQLVDFLAENKVEAVVTPEGTPFDPNQHEALKQEPSDTVPEGHILYTIRKGYILKDRLIRPANVVVSQGASESNQEGESS